MSSPGKTKTIQLRVIPGSKTQKLSQQSDGSYIARINAKAHNGNANHALISLLSQELKLPPNKIFIHKGLKSRHKQVILIS